MRDWFEALEKRNLALEIYDETILDELEKLITNTYYPMMILFDLELKTKCSNSGE